MQEGKVIVRGGFIKSWEKNRSERQGRKGEGRERYTQLNSEFQRRRMRDKKTFLNEQCKEIEKGNRMGKTRDLVKKTGAIKRALQERMGMVKDWNSKNLTEVEEIKR